VDHHCADNSQIPEYWIDNVKSNIRVHYAHTSHGSQLITGLNVLETQNTNFRCATDSCALPSEAGALRIYDGQIDDDYITPDLYWDGGDALDLTRRVLSNNPSINVSQWAWCGQVSTASSSYIQTYLTNLNALSKIFTNVTFVYMTGHLDGSGANGNLNSRNNQIRQYCRDNNKALYDFADIERFDPDGADYLDIGGGGGDGDGCQYDSGNWGVEWCDAHPDSPLCASCECAHSQPLNCNLKGRAFWWLLARIAGWPGSPRANTMQVETGRIGIVWSDLCTGRVYRVQRAGQLTSSWSVVSVFTNHGYQTNWSEALPSNPAAFYQLMRN
jgi:hypothetical protein